MADNVVVINRGQRTFILKPSIDANGKQTPRILKAGDSIETIDAHEAEYLLGFRDVADASKVVPSTSQKIDEMKKQIADLQAENSRLASVTLPPEEAKPEEDAVALKPKSKKGK